MRSLDVEVLMPFNNVNQYFIPAIKSVLASQGVNVRLLLIDDRPDVVSTIPKIPTLDYSIIRTSRRGYGNALAEGLQNVHSEFFAIMNADDLIHPLRIIRQVSSLNKFSSDLSIGRILKFNDKLRITSQKLGHMPSGNYDPRVLLLGSYGGDATWCGRTEVLKSWNISNELSSDWITSLRYFPSNLVTYVPNAYYFYRQHNQQLTRTFDYKDNAFDGIYREWQLFCETCGFCYLNKEVARLICAPWSSSAELTRESLQLSMNWLSDFNENTQKRYSSLVNRRKAYLSFKALQGGLKPSKFLMPSTLALINYLHESLLNIFRTFIFAKFLRVK